MKILFRPYTKRNERPITTKWYRTEEEALEWGKTLNNKEDIIILHKDTNSLLKNRKKSGFRGLV